MAKEMAVMLVALSKEKSTKLKGQTRLNNMLKSNSNLRIFTIKKDDYQDLVLNMNYAYILTEMLTGTTNSVFRDYAYPTALTVASKLSRKYAIKTGTTDTDFWIAGYNPDVVMVASGSEVSTLEEGAALLRTDGVKVRIVSVPSEGLFRNQSKEYQESVIPTGSKIFGLTAGLPVNLEGLVGANGKIWGLESFGFSAPYKVLDEKLGFTGQNVYKQVKELLGHSCIRSTMTYVHVANNMQKVDSPLDIFLEKGDEK